MEEELNENELEERFYSMLHYVDETQEDVKQPSKDAAAIVESAARSTVRRYWRPDQPRASPYNKVNTPAKPAADAAKPERDQPPPETLPIFQAPVPVKHTITIIEHQVNNVVELDTSDEDEVVEVKLPPKPTITIESSDDEADEEKEPSKQDSAKPTQEGIEREVSASPVPSVVSSMSDEFIRNDCIAFNISSKRPDTHSFDFSLHGADLLDQSTPAKKKKKKKSKDTTLTPAAAQSTPEKPANTDECFATPKTKAKNKKQKNNSNKEKSVPNADVYDSDSNQSITFTNKKVLNPYSVTERSLPSVDVYESDSNQSECIKDGEKLKQNSPVKDCGDMSSGDHTKVTSKARKNSSNIDSTIDLTESDDLEVSDIQENIMMGNVSGFTENNDYEEEPPTPTAEIKLGSTNVPAILNEDLDFDNLGKGVCKNRRYSLSTLRQEMEKFYNESWGGENFNHREIQKYMSRDKSLWAIDPKDRMPSYNNTKRKPIRGRSPGRAVVCHMCGGAHSEARCPRKICVNCAAPADLYTAVCRHCCHWPRLSCATCGQKGHPHTHCPDLWRRYHNTTDLYDEMEENHQNKKHWQLFCSGCARRGHLVHTCRLSLPFSVLPLHSPYVRHYAPVYAQRGNTQDDTITSATQRNDNKRHSKSPAHENHAPKKKFVLSDTPKKLPRKQSESKESETIETPKEMEKTVSAPEQTERAPDFIPIGPSNRDKKGQVIQDNEVSDTSDVITSARIYVTNDLVDKLKTKDGEDWLKETAQTLNVTVQNTENTSFLSIRGKVADQEAFQCTLRDWHKKANKDASKSDTEADVTQESENDLSMSSDNIPKNRNNVLRKLNKALDSLKDDIGEPNELYKELMYLQNRHQQLLKQKVISPRQLSNNRENINDMLKKLNMVLVGQAGLGDGAAHVSELYALQERLIQYRQKRIPADMRRQIGAHYQRVFGAAPRDDYSLLLQTFNGARQKKTKPFKAGPTKKKFKVIPPVTPEPARVRVEALTGGTQRRPLVEKTRNKLVFYHKRLVRARPGDSALRKTRVELVRKLHSHIASLARNANMSSKALKKMKKIQERAQIFLNNV